ARRSSTTTAPAKRDPAQHLVAVEIRPWPRQSDLDAHLSWLQSCLCRPFPARYVLNTIRSWRKARNVPHSATAASTANDPIVASIPEARALPSNISRATSNTFSTGTKYVHSAAPVCSINIKYIAGSMTTNMSPVMYACASRYDLLNTLMPSWMAAINATNNAI